MPRVRSYAEPYVPLPKNYEVTYGNANLGDREATGGYTNATTGQIVLSNRDQYSLAHEIGHLVDAQALTPAQRARFQRIMGAPKGAWNQGTGITGNGARSPVEWFADYYAAAATGMDPGREYQGAYETQPTRQKLRVFKRELARIGAQQGLRQYGTDGIGREPQPGGFQ